MIGKKEDDLVLKLLSYPVHPELMIPHGDDHGCKSWSDLAIVLKVGKHDLLPISLLITILERISRVTREQEQARKNFSDFSVREKEAGSMVSQGANPP